MTYSPDRPALNFEDIEGAAAALRRAGCRFSAARRVILDVLFAAEGPVSAEYIADGLGGRLTRSDLSSVYRNLEVLEELGVVRHVHIGHGPSLYAISGRPPCEYIVCERCDAVKSLSPASLEPVRAAIREKHGYEVRFNHFPIVGLCPRCASDNGQSHGQSPRNLGEVAHDHPHGDDHHEHSHEHSHGDRVHSHPHVHRAGVDGEHVHRH